MCAYIMATSVLIYVHKVSHNLVLVSSKMQRLKQLKDFDKARRFKQRKENSAEATGNQRVKETTRYTRTHTLMTIRVHSFVCIHMLALTSVYTYAQIHAYTCH